MKRLTFFRLPVVAVMLFLFLALILLNAPASLLAHPEGNAHHNPLPTHATNTMRAFWADRQGPQALSAMASTSCTGGFAGTYPCNNVDLLAFMPLNDIGGTGSNSEANDIWGWTDPQTGNEYAIIGRVFGTSFVDISDPVNPVYLGNLPTHGAFGSSWRDIKTYANHAFIVSEANQHGMQVFDLTQLRNVTNPPVTFSETAHYNKNAQAHNIVINEDTGFAYLVGTSGKNNCSGGLHMVDISTPTSPTFAGCFSSDGYTHDAQCVIYSGPDTEHQGKEICFNSNEDTLTIIDVTNKQIPVQLSRTSYSLSAYTHQGWLTEDQAYFLLDDELDEQNFGHPTRTRVFDVSDLDAPDLTGIFDGSTTAIDHNLYVKGNFAYQANYRAGLRILDISGVSGANLQEVAYFDIYPADDFAQFNAAWSNYPFFESGVVIVSGIEQGLFILQPNLGPVDNAPTVTLDSPADGATVAGTVNVTATASDDVSVAQVEFFAGVVSIGVDTTAPYAVSWDSTLVADGIHTITATATDSIGQKTSDSNEVTVDNVVEPPIHVGDLDAATSAARGGKWNATVTVTVHDGSENPVANATVNGDWSNNGSGSCTTGANGQCSISQNNISRKDSSITFTVTGVSAAGYTYDSASNHDPDGDSDNGNSIVVLSP